MFIDAVACNGALFLFMAKQYSTVWFQRVLLTPAFGLEWAPVLSPPLGCCVAVNSHGQVLA